MGIDRRDVDADTSDESFVGRWSRRKHQARAETGDVAPLTEPAPEPEQPPETTLAEPAGAPERVLTDADMPPIESLDASSDWSGFMSKGVSSELRKSALRKLFHFPEFNVRDGLNDYDDDFTTFEPLGDLVTADMRHQIEREEARVREAQERETQERETQEPEAQEREAQERETQDRETQEPEAQDRDGHERETAAAGHAEHHAEAGPEAALASDEGGGQAPGGRVPDAGVPQSGEELAGGVSESIEAGGRPEADRVAPDAGRSARPRSAGPKHRGQQEGSG